MNAGEVPRGAWIKFFDEFSKERQGWIATVEVIGQDIGDQEEAAGLPLVGISADLKAGENRIDVAVGTRPDAHMTHIIDKPQIVELKPAEEPGHEAIEVRSEDGTITLLTFRH